MTDPIHVKGLEDLQRTLSELPPKLQETVLVKAVSEGGKVIQEEAVARAPVRVDEYLKKISARGAMSTKARLPGFLKASIGRHRVDAASGSQVHYEVGVLRREAFYAAFVEYGFRHFAGHVTRVTKGGYRKFSSFVHVAARPFLRPALDSKGDAAVNKMAETLREGIERDARELGLK